MAARPLSRGSTGFRRGVAGAGIAAGLALYAYQVGKYKRTVGRRFDMDDAPQPGTDEFNRLLQAMTGTPQRSGNRVTVLRNGATLEDMRQAISKATSTVDFSSYIFWPGEAADGFMEAFVDRARAGVDVNVVIDAYGSARFAGDHVERLEQAGVHVSFFRPPRWYTLNRVNNRMHRRLLIVDGTIGYAGGVGVADVWTGDARDPEHWRETHLRLEGPVVLDVFGAFMENWMEATGELLTGRHVPVVDPFEDGVGVQLTRGTPTGGPTATSELFYAAISGARRRLWMTTAYFSPDAGFEEALRGAAERGVDVRILVNGQKVDKEIVREAGQRSYEPLAEAGVRIFEYDRTMLHAKVLLIDDTWANVGSGNFDSRSFDHDLEVNVSVTDAACVEELAGHFLEDLGSASEFDLDQWRQRPLGKRMKERATDLLRPSL